MKINFPLNPLVFNSKEFEQPCGICGEVLLIAAGDPISVYVGESGEPEAVLCVRCSKKNKTDKKDAS